MQGNMKPTHSIAPWGRLCRAFNAVAQPTGLSIVILLMFGASCSRHQANPHPSSQVPSTMASKVPLPPDDRSEVLLWHLLRRNEESDAEIERLQNEVLRHDNKCLEDQIAILEGRTRPADPKRALDEDIEKQRASAKSMNANLSRMVEEMLDTEDVIEYHNRRHPESPQADVKDLLRQFCGDCTRDRAIRDSRLKEEAQKYEHSGSKE
jgi:hypothetical protein